MKNQNTKKVQYQTVEQIKDYYPVLSLGRICKLFGVTRQAYYQHIWRNHDRKFKEYIIVELTKEIRQRQPMIGTRKIYEILKPDFEQLNLKVGRDQLFDILSANDLLIRKRVRKVRTTNSNHVFRRYPNLIKEFEPKAPNQLWVGDITYIKTEKGFVYGYFITDGYSRKIMGYQISDNLESINAVICLQMALNKIRKPTLGLIHHSDRGLQYCSHEYVKLLQEYKIKISMTENGDPRENAIAERLNGIIKEEFLSSYTISNLQMAKEEVANAVEIYNNERPHLSCDLLTPEQAHKKYGALKKHWKNYYYLRKNNVKPVNLI